jgi:hypothetical protein
MNVKLGSCLFTVPSLGLPVLGVFLLILVLISAASKLRGIFTINGKKAIVVNQGIGDE